MSVARYLTDIANYIRMRLGNEKKYRLENMEEGINQVYEKAFSDGSADGYQVGFSYGTTEGYENAVKEFWNVFQDKGNRINYRYAFYDGFPDEIFSPQYDFKCYDNCSNMFTYADMTRIEKTLDFSGGSIQCGSVFANAYYLKYISKVIIRDNMTFNSWFTRADALEDITFEGIIGNSIDFKDCKKLTKTSIENIVSVLSDIIAGMTVTLSKTAVNNAFTENEWNTLVATKSNWTFSLI